MAKTGTPRVVVAGAGLAGAATACFLAEGGADVVLLERENLPGTHATAQNAAMVRQVVSDSGIGELAREGAAFIRGEAAAGNLALAPNGSFLTASGARWKALEREAEMAREGGVEVRLLSHAEAVHLVPPLDGAAFEGAVHTPSDGVVDVANLLALLLRRASQAGARVFLEREVTGVTVRDGAVAEVSSGGERFPADVLVNAAGAWASGVAALAGATLGPVTPMRRHIFVTPPLPFVDRAWPWVWDVAHDVYFRPESGGLLLSPCDEDPHPPGRPDVSEAAAELLATKLESYMPRLSAVPIGKRWAGLRSFSPSRRFLIGWDPSARGFFWAAGLGGHGVTCSAAVGRRAAREIISAH